jgi:hypothetical protein
MANQGSGRPADIYTLEGLDWLKQALAAREAQWDGYTGNNPNKWASQRKSLRTEIELVTEVLKDKGIIPRTQEEILKHRLDAQTPSRLKGCCTQYEKQWYRMRLIGKNERGYWQWTWDPIPAEEVAKPGSYVHPGPKPTN